METVNRGAPAWRGGLGRLWPMLIASVSACGYPPWIVFGLLGGAVADRADQRRPMWTVAAVRGALVTGLAAAVWGLNAPVSLAAAFFVPRPALVALRPLREADVFVAAPDGDVTTARRQG
ncbi:hypothetical protein ACGFX8_15950 [Streptomyces sp. NPDC048362]|uniref:hypothetical protein n=1 Tax=Streptomyces sp. NPDC048362 TaxID=3365539 RepID=UPI00371FFAEB